MSIPYGMLGLLRRGATHGYQLKSDFESATAATWPLNVGQVYATLQRLERDGLVATEGAGTDDAGERRRYRLTDAGEEHLDRWFATPVPRETPARDELVIKLAMAMRLPATDAVAVIDVQRSATMSALQALTRAKAAAGGDLAASLVTDAAIFHAEAEIRWLDHCETGLRERRRGAAS